MVKFIGDVSLEDCELLIRYTKGKRDVLEFGVGGSTQIMAQVKSGEGQFVSVDTDPVWICATEERLEKLKVRDKVRFTSYTNWYDECKNSKFDVVFDDGIDLLRRQFGLDSWQLLKDDGVLIFHDTRRSADFANAMCVAQTYFLEIEHIAVNEKVNGVASNLTILKKKKRDDYVNWNNVEGKQPYEYGCCGKEPDSFWDE